MGCAWEEGCAAGGAVGVCGGGGLETTGLGEAEGAAEDVREGEGLGGRALGIDGCGWGEGDAGEGGRREGEGWGGREEEEEEEEGEEGGEVRGHGGRLKPLRRRWGVSRGEGCSVWESGGTGGTGRRRLDTLDSGADVFGEGWRDRRGPEHFLMMYRVMAGGI